MKNHSAQETAHTHHSTQSKKQSQKKTELFKAYRKRKINTGANSFILNIEELATVWHFPMSHVATPQVQKAPSKSAEPPIGLPLEGIGGLPIAKKVSEEATDDKRSFMTDTGEDIVFDDFS